MALQYTETEPTVVTFVNPNILYLTQNGYLTDAETAFLFTLSAFLDANNCVNEENGRYLTQQEFADRMKVSRRTASSLLNSLERKGLIKRKRNPLPDNSAARHQIYVNPHILFFEDDIDDIPENIIQLFSDVNGNGFLNGLPFKIPF